MSLVFLDTVGLVALWNRSDQWHASATAAFARLASIHASYATTTYVLLECANAAARRPFRRDVVAMRDELSAHSALIEPTSSDVSTAWAEYEQGSPADPGIVDCVSIAVMRRLGINEVFSNDYHFRAAGFTTLF